MKSLIGMAALSKQLAADVTVKQDWKVLKIEKVEVHSNVRTYVHVDVNILNGIVYHFTIWLRFQYFGIIL